MNKAMVRLGVGAVFLSWAVSSFTGCANARPAQPAGFAPHMESSLARKDEAFHRGWVSGDASRIRPGDFHEVYIAPVDTSHLKELNWWQSQSGKDQERLEADSRELASYMRSEFETAFRKYPQKEFRVVDQPGPKTIIIELSLIELVPSKVYWNAMAATASMVVPGAGALSAAGKGSVALEGRIRAGRGGEIIASFADREADTAALVNVHSVTKFYGNSEEHIQTWAAQLAEIFYTPRDHKVKDAPAFRLIVW